MVIEHKRSGLVLCGDGRAGGSGCPVCVCLSDRSLAEHGVCSKLCFGCVFAERGIRRFSYVSAFLLSCSKQQVFYFAGRGVLSQPAESRGSAALVVAPGITQDYPKHSVTSRIFLRTQKVISVEAFVGLGRAALFHLIAPPRCMHLQHLCMYSSPYLTLHQTKRFIHAAAAHLSLRSTSTISLPVS